MALLRNSLTCIALTRNSLAWYSYENNIIFQISKTRPKMWEIMASQKLLAKQEKNNFKNKISSVGLLLCNTLKEFVNSHWFDEKFLRLLKFMFSKQATKIDEIFPVDLTLCSKCQTVGEDFVNFCGLLRKHELYSIENLIDIL